MDEQAEWTHQHFCPSCGMTWSHRGLECWGATKLPCPRSRSQPILEREAIRLDQVERAADRTRHGY